MADAGKLDAQADPPPRLCGDDGEDRILAALDFLRGVRPAGGDPYWAANTASQKARLQEWAESLGLLLSPEAILPQLRRGGQEHDYFLDPIGERCFKLTRLGVFDAHDKNVVRSSVDPAVLVPFDGIPVRPEGGFLDFIRDTLARGESLSVVRTTHTTSRVPS